MDYLRAKQAGIPNDLTRTLSNPDLFLEESVRIPREHTPRLKSSPTD